MKQYFDMAAALRNTPANALREAGYLDRAADMLEGSRPNSVSEGMIAAARKAITDRYYAGGKVHQLTAVKPADLANIVLQAAFACEECDGSGYIRWLGRDNSEVVDECSSCTPAPSGQGVSGEVNLRAAAQAVLDSAERPGSRAEYGIGEDCKEVWHDYQEVAQKALDDLAAALATPAPSCAPGEVPVPVAVIRELRLAEKAYADARSGAVERLDAAVTAILACEKAALSPQGLDAKEGGE